MKAKELALYIINEYHKKEGIISNLVLQKIMYLIQHKLLQANFSGVDVIEEDFEAWQYGPVIREVYVQYVSFGAMDLGILANEDDVINFKNLLKLEVKQIIDSVIAKYINTYPWDLVKLTHIKNGAWQKTMAENNNVYGRVIPKNMIKGDLIENN